MLPSAALGARGADSCSGKIDKSQLAIAEPKRLRDKAHLKFVASQPCLICGRQPSDPHHLRFAQPRAIGLKVSDEFTVPLCRGHHRQLHQTGNEEAWWESLGIDALEASHRSLGAKPSRILGPGNRWQHKSNVTAPDGRYWHKADIPAPTIHVRYRG